MQRKLVLLMVTTALVSVAVFSLSQPNTVLGEDEPPHADTAPDFHLFSLDGEQISLSDLRGKNVFINFWASWCPPCVLEMPHLEEVHRALDDSDTIILAINVGESSQTVARFMEQHGYTFTVLLDPSRGTAARYNARSIPTSIFIDKHGVIRHRRVGYMDTDAMWGYLEQL